jgi:hypothetical protein
MKKTIILSAFVLFAVAVMAQSDKYVKAMQANIAAADTTRSVEGLTNMANSFERIANAEKTQWLPYYYAALADINLAYSYAGEQGNGNKAEKIDPLADKAEALLNKAEELAKDNAEIYIAKKMIASVRMMADPMNRYMKYGPIASQALETAKKLDPENPRIYILEGEDKFYTPAQFGGSKEEAKVLFETAIKKFDTFKPQSDIHPHWGRETASYFLKQMK